MKLVLSDLIVIWRAWALFPDKRCVILPPFILWIGLLGEWTFLREGSHFSILNFDTPRDVGRLLRMGIDPHRPHGLDNKPSNNRPIDHNDGALHRNQRYYDLFDCREIMVCRCGLNSLDPPAHHEVIRQELPHFHHQDPRLEGANESSADHIASSR